MLQIAHLGYSGELMELWSTWINMPFVDHTFVAIYLVTLLTDTNSQWLNTGNAGFVSAAHHAPTSNSFPQPADKAT